MFNRSRYRILIFLRIIFKCFSQVWGKENFWTPRVESNLRWYDFAVQSSANWVLWRKRIFPQHAEKKRTSQPLQSIARNEICYGLIKYWSSRSGHIGGQWSFYPVSSFGWSLLIFKVWTQYFLFCNVHMRLISCKLISSLDTFATIFRIPFMTNG